MRACTVVHPDTLRECVLPLPHTIRHRDVHGNTWRYGDDPAPEETRVVLVKPGDVLLIGNVGHMGDPGRLSAAIAELSESVGIEVVAFAADIDISKVPAG